MIDGVESINAGGTMRGIGAGGIAGVQRNPQSSPLPKGEGAQTLPNGEGAFEPFLRGATSKIKGAASELHTQARRLVAQAFVAPILKQMRESPFRSELLDGGRGGRAFAGLYDQHLVDRVSRLADRKLTASLVRKLEARTRKSTEPLAQPQTPVEKINVHVAPGLRA